MSVLKEKITGIVEEIHKTPGVQTCALISRDGICLGKQTVTNFNDAWFAAMCATILTSAESVAVILKTEAPRHITVQTSCGNIIIIGSGDKLLIAIYVDNSANLADTYEVLYAMAEEIMRSF